MAPPYRLGFGQSQAFDAQFLPAVAAQGDDAYLCPNKGKTSARQKSD
jgi:hypothetical protein